MGAAIAPGFFAPSSAAAGSIGLGAALGPLGLAAGIAGGAISAYGTYQGYEARADAASYRAQVAANNAIIARRNEEMEIQSGEIGAVNVGMKTRASVGKTLAGQGASGVDVGTGSFVKARVAESELGMLDALTVRSNAAKKAWADETQATNFEAESRLDSMEADQARSAGPVAAIGSLLSSASTVGGNYSRWSSTR